MPGGRLRRSEVGELASRAQSSGEWPGSRITLRDGLAGLVECVGGGASVEVPGCRAAEARLLGGARPPPPRDGPGESIDELLLTPLSRGGRGGGGISADGAPAGADGTGAAESEGTAGGAAAPVARATAAAEAGGCGDDSESEGTGPEDVGDEAEAARAFGVVCGEFASEASSPACVTMDGGGDVTERSVCDFASEDDDFAVLSLPLARAEAGDSSEVVSCGCSI